LIAVLNRLRRSMTDLVVTTTAGRVRGTVTDGVARFFGVPYAAPPVGARRFAPPEPHPAWEGERDGSVRGPNAPQIHSREFPGLDMKPVVRPEWHRGDDFLTLNVWAPEVTSSAPVMVFIHGGAFVVGDKDAPVIDGTAFARAGVVCIAINYRLGVEGFLPIPGVPTNLGLRDQLAALQWVRENVAGFGGNPANVTVFGESAGAMSIACLVTSPMARGLFRRAIIESGHGSMVRPIEVAQRLVRKLAKELRVTPDLAGFRQRTVEECLQAQDQVMQPTTRIDLRDASGREPAYGLSRFLPVYGDDVLPASPLEALAKGAGADVDVLIGTNREEMNLYMVPTGLGEKVRGWLAPLLLKRVEPQARPVLRAYGLGERGRRGGEVLTAAMSDLVFRLPARRYAAAHQGHTYFYEMDWRSPACDGRLGACHGVELPFVFDTLESCSGPGRLLGATPPEALAERIQGLWMRFATDGKLPWPEHEASSPQVFALAAGEARPEEPLPAARILG